ncbi:MAG TPA: M28 family peptidase, partial [Xanthomonadales bacterium]|nr:M28 family peptidase [Xanthomonadales bacterium]
CININALTVLIATLSFVHFMQEAQAADNSCLKRINNTPLKLLECVSVEGVRAHQAALQTAADENNGNRSAGTSGYDASVNYVVTRLVAAGYSPEIHEFDFELQPDAVLQQLAPIAAIYETGNFTGSGVGAVTGPVIAVDINLVPPRETTSGCEAADFAGLDFSGPNDIALIQRGGCNFSVSAANAEAAGAEAVIIFNQGNIPEREGLIVGNVATFPDGSPSNLTIPVVGASFAHGVSLSEAGSIAFVEVQPAIEATGFNVIAELKGRSSSRVIMAGAHLDSVQAGPGIQDNGSGSAALLETAIQMARVKPLNTVRFAWWDAAELELLGSTAYVNDLSPAELGRIALYLNFDTIASPNFVYFIYDGDDSDGVGAGSGPAGSAQIERLFETYYTLRGVPFKGFDLVNSSDHAPFMDAGIPVGGLSTGTVDIKTPLEESIWGGTAGEQYDPCYHQACDTYDNISLQALDVNSDAIAFVILAYALLPGM